jgi:hypothetical protein
MNRGAANRIKVGIGARDAGKMSIRSYLRTIFVFDYRSMVGLRVMFLILTQVGWAEVKTACIHILTQGFLVAM